MSQQPSNRPKRIRILNRNSMRNERNSWENWPDHAGNIISINCPEDPALFKEPFPGFGLLTLHFHDISYPSAARQIPNFILFTEEMAEEFLDFVDTMPPSDTLYIHCFAGVSRSGAVGTFLREYWDLDYQEFCDSNPQICPNVLVLQTLRNVALARDWKQ